MNGYTDIDRKSDFKYFLDNYDSLFKKYGHKFVAIKDKNILGVFDTASQAFNNLSCDYEVGTYILQECTGDESGYMVRMTRCFIKG